MARFVISGISEETVRSIGGTGIKRANKPNLIFAGLSDAQKSALIKQGASVRPVKKVSPLVSPPTVSPPIVSPPIPQEALPMYTRTR